MLRVASPTLNGTVCLIYIPGSLQCTFSPCYPNKLWMEETTFCNAFPFHIVFGEDVRFHVYMCWSMRVLDYFSFTTTLIGTVFFDGLKNLWNPNLILLSICLFLSLVCVLDSQLKVRQTGVNIQKFVPGLQASNTTLDQYFTIIHPQVNADNSWTSKNNKKITYMYILTEQGPNQSSLTKYPYAK